nr:transposase [Caballeronia mineralivorans]
MKSELRVPQLLPRYDSFCRASFCGRIESGFRERNLAHPCSAAKAQSRGKHSSRTAQGDQVQPPRHKHGRALQRPVDVASALKDLQEKRHPIDVDVLKALSPCRREHINRLGDYLLDLQRRAPSLDPTIDFSFKSVA